MSKEELTRDIEALTAGVETFGTFLNDTHYLKCHILFMMSTVGAEHIIQFCSDLVNDLEVKEAMADIGPGDYRITRAVGQPFDRMYFVDTNEDILAIPDSHPIKVGQEVFKYHCGVLEAELPENALDFVLCSHVLYYLDFSDWIEATSKMLRTLKKDGKLFVILGGEKLGKADLIRNFNGQPIQIAAYVESCRKAFESEDIAIDVQHFVETTSADTFDTFLHLANFALANARLVVNKTDLTNYIEANLKTPEGRYSMQSQQSYIIFSKLKEEWMWGDFFKSREDAKWYICFCCVISNGIFGLAMVLCGYTIEDMATDVGTTSNGIESIFLTRFLGNCTGLLVRTVFATQLQSMYALDVSQVIMLISMACMPYTTTKWGLYLLFYIYGFCYGIFQISSVNLIRALQGPRAAVWMAYYLCAFCTCGVILAIIQLSGISFREEFILVDVIIATTIVLLTFAVDPYQDPELAVDMKTEQKQEDIPHYYVDICCACMLALNIGVQETLVFYVESFIDDEGVDCNRTVAYLIYVVSLAVGYFTWIGVQHIVTNDNIIVCSYIAFAIQLVPLSIICVNPTNAVSLQLNLAAFGFISPPAVNLAFDLCYRYTYRSTLSSSFMLLGLSSGASLLPYITLLVWDGGIGTYAIFYMSELYAIVALCILPTVPFLTYIPELNPLNQQRNRQQYMPVQSHDDGEERHEHSRGSVDASSSTSTFSPIRSKTTALPTEVTL